MRQAPIRRALFLSVGGYTWTGATWALTGGRAFNTPTLGSELLTNGGLEAWNSATDLQSWTESVAGTSTINRESSIVQSGTYAVRLDIDGSNSLAGFFQTALTVGNWYQLSGYARASSAGARALFGNTNAPWGGDKIITLGTTYAQVLVADRAVNASVFIGRNSAAGAALFIDDLSLRALSLATLPATVIDVAGQTVTAKPYAITNGTQAGVISHLDSAASPANFIIAYHDGGTSIKMDKCVGGTYTSLVSATTGFVSDAVIEIRRPSGNTFQLWYGGTQRGTDQTISDAGIISNTRYGLFSTYSANTFSEGLTLGGVLIPFRF